MHELLTIAEMAQADRLAVAGGVPGIDLMENAGRAVADCVGEFQGQRVLVVAGPGNNGGDGFAAGRLLAERGHKVHIALLGDVARLKGDAAIAAQRWTGPVEPASAQAVKDHDIIVDALFGAGLDRPLDGAAVAVIQAINAAGVPVVAVDLPSGINGDSGQVMNVAVKARATVTFFRRKPGHLLLPGRLHCGRLQIADIGIPATVLGAIKPRAFVNSPDVWAPLPAPKTEGHKYDRGHTLVVAGHLPMTGAARLAARGALRAGSGLVTIASPLDSIETFARENVAVMVVQCDGERDLDRLLNDPRRNSVILGPGGGVGLNMRALIMAALASQAAVVLDADALSSFAEYPGRLFAAIKSRLGPVVLTPHEGEFARLFNLISEKIDVNS
ncbi:MAG: NAD(P)H-hydrate epimerase, partial [Pseudolabrys sp.]|nr:NAD(P)H-hydrate epimerase [Pseudolabrys sp.]